MPPRTDAPAPTEHRPAVVLLAGAGLAYLLLAGLDAKATAVLAGSLDFFGLKQVALNGLLCLGFGYAAWALHRGRATGRGLGLLLAGAAAWRALDTTLDAAAAAVADDLQYWRPGQLATTALLVTAGVLAALAAVRLVRRGT